MHGTISLPLVDLSSPDRASTAKSIRQACLDHGFFYLLNHGIEDSIFQQVLRESKKLFSLPLHQKMSLHRNKDDRGYTPLYGETHDHSSNFKGDLKENFDFGFSEGNNSEFNLNHWPSEVLHCDYWTVTSVIGESKNCEPSSRRRCVPSGGADALQVNFGARAVSEVLVSLIALALNLDDQYFEKIGALHAPLAFVRLLHYLGEVPPTDDGNYGTAAHSDFGMVTLLATDGVSGLQICRGKDIQPQFWEDVSPIDGSTLYRVLAVGQECYSVAFFLNPNADCIVKCLENCCDEKSPPRFPPIRRGDYLQERFRSAYLS